MNPPPEGDGLITSRGGLGGGGCRDQRGVRVTPIEEIVRFNHSVEMIDVINRDMLPNVGDGLDEVLSRSIAAKLTLGEGVTRKLQDAANVLTQALRVVAILAPVR